jgi:DNA topoisomerase-1
LIYKGLDTAPLSRAKVLAAVVKLLETTLIRIGKSAKTHHIELQNQRLIDIVQASTTRPY